MDRLHAYFTIFVTTFILTFFAFVMDLFAFNGSVDFVVAMGTTIVIGPMLALVYILCLELSASYPNMKYIAPGLAWCGFLLSLLIACFVYPACDPEPTDICMKEAIMVSIVFYGIATSMLTTVIVPFMQYQYAPKHKHGKKKRK